MKTLTQKIKSLDDEIDTLAEESYAEDDFHNCEAIEKVIDILQRKKRKLKSLIK